MVVAAANGKLRRRLRQSRDSPTQKVLRPENGPSDSARQKFKMRPLSRYRHVEGSRVCLYSQSVERTNCCPSHRNHSALLPLHGGNVKIWAHDRDTSVALAHSSPLPSHRLLQRLFQVSPSSIIYQAVCSNVLALQLCRQPSKRDNTLPLDDNSPFRHEFFNGPLGDLNGRSKAEKCFLYPSSARLLLV
jgi:hypothetical protein